MNEPAYQDPAYYQQQQPGPGVVCPQCGGHNVSIQLEQQAAKLRTRDTGCLWNIGRTCLIVCTLGLWLIVGKRKETTAQKFKNKKIAICQNCGHSWYVN